MLPGTKIVPSKRWSLHLGSRMIVTDHNGGEMMALSSRLIISKYHCAAARINDDHFAALRPGLATPPSRGRACCIFQGMPFCSLSGELCIVRAVPACATTGESWAT